MTRYVLRRLAASAVLLLLLVTLVFGLLHAAPGDPLNTLTGGGGHLMKLPPEQRASLERTYGLDKPLPVQYLSWLSACIRGDWGTSISQQRPVSRIIAEALPATILLALAAFLVEWSLALPLGILAARRKKSWAARLATNTSLVFYALPTFWLALMAIWGLTYRLPLFPSSHIASVGMDGQPWLTQLLDRLHHLALPALVLGIVAFGASLRYVRSSLLEVLGQDYIRTARAKGLSQRRIVWVHAMRPALAPVLQLMGVSLPALLNGVLVVELIFGWPGLGADYDPRDPRPRLPAGDGHHHPVRRSGDPLQPVRRPAARRGGPASARPTGAERMTQLASLPAATVPIADAAPPTGRRGLWIGVAILAVFALAALAAPLLSDADPNEPFDAAAGKRLAPGSARYVLRFADARLPVLAERVELAGDTVLAHRLDRVDRYPQDRLSNLGPDGLPPLRTFFLGTDHLGRDLWSRLLHGARISFAVAFFATALALTLGVAIGGLAALGGRWLDLLLMRLVDLVLAVPRLFLLITVIALFRPGGWAIVLVLGATGWMTVARMVRAELLSLAGRDFVTAARSYGQHPMATFFKHLLPNALAPVLVTGGLMLGEVVLAESALSFLGLGVPEPTPTWGKMVADVTAGALGGWWVAAIRVGDYDDRDRLQPGGGWGAGPVGPSGRWVVAGSPG